MRMKLPYDGLPKPRMFPLDFPLDANIGGKKSLRKYAVQGAASQAYLHSMASQIMNEIFNKHLNSFVKLCHARGHKPNSVLLVSTMSYDGGENVGTIDMYEKTLELEEIFQKVASSAIFLIPYSVRFDGSHDRISACDAIDLDMVHSTVCIGEIGDKPDLSLFPLSLLTCSGSVNLSGSFYPLSYKLYKLCY